METTAPNRILLDFGSIWLRPDHVLLVTFNTGTQITYKQVCKLMDTITTISRDRRRPLILDLSNNINLSIEARLFLMSERAADFKPSLAFIVTSPFSKWVSNLSARINKPSFRVRSFLTEAAALGWSKNAFSYQHHLQPQAFKASHVA